MDLLMEILLEFILEGYVEIIEHFLPNNKLKKWQCALIKITCLIIALACAIFIIIGFCLVAEDKVVQGIWLIGVGAFLLAVQIAVAVIASKIKRKEPSMREKIESINEYVREVERQTGRKIYVCGATKTRNVDEINQAIAYGLTIVGENRAQEFRDKHELISKTAEQHFIGHLQSNKIKYVVGKATLIHSCDSVEIATEISNYAKKLGITQDLLIEINISGEEDKHGFLPEQVFSAVEQLKNLENLRFRGVMTVLPHLPEANLVPYCERMKQFFDSLKENYFKDDFIYLSMGMSEDYKIAVKCGANMIRLGRAIFGERTTAKTKEEN